MIGVRYDRVDARVEGCRPLVDQLLTILQDKVIARILVEDPDAERARAGGGTKEARVGER